MFKMCFFICQWVVKLTPKAQGLWILATSPRVLVSVYTWDSLLIKDSNRLWPMRAVPTSNMHYAFRVQVYWEVLYLEFYSVSQNSLLKMKYCSVKDCNSTSSFENGILHTIKE